MKNEQLIKPVLVIILTDGIPTPHTELNELENNIRETIYKLQNSKYGIKAVGFEFAQIGTDSKAQKWLDELDNDPKIGHNIDVTSNFETEQMQYRKNGLELSFHLWILKLLLGGIDAKYDSEDE